MPRALRYALYALVAVAVAIGAVFALAPYADGPLGLIPGGPFHGAATGGPEPDWEALAGDARTIELEVNPEAPRSLTMGIVVHGGQLYLPATLVPERKRWPREVAADPRVRIRVDGRIYERRAQRVDDPELVQELIERGAEKYSPNFFAPDRTWFYRLAPPGS